MRLPKTPGEVRQSPLSRVNGYIVCCSLAALAFGCVTTPRQNDEIEATRAVIARIESQPLAGEAAAQELERAHASLSTAESLSQRHRKAAEIDGALYLARRHADIAEQQIALAQAQRGIENAEAERQAALLRAREKEATLNAQEAERRAAEAEEAKRRVELLESELRELNSQKELNARQTDRGLVLTLGDVLFDTGKADLKPGAMPALDRLAKFLTDSPDRTVTIEGHTDSVGSEGLNQALSQARADAVRSALVQRGVEANRVNAVGKGEGFPVASNDTSAGRQQNRRVEIVIGESSPS